MRYEIKRSIVCGLYLFVWPFGFVSWLPYKLFGNAAAFGFFSKLLSLIPGKLGQYIRTAFYKMTLTQCHYDLMVGFCSFFSHPAVKVGRRVGLGSFTIVGPVNIGENVMISSRVSVLSRDSRNVKTLSTSAYSTVAPAGTTSIGADCWIGEGAIVMASLGRHCMVSAGSVVTQQAPDHVVAIGNPARFLKSAEGTEHVLS